MIENLQNAWDARQSLFEQCNAEQTDCYRLFHGTVEGLSGVTVDRYGPQLLVQSFHESLDPHVLEQLKDFYLPLFSDPLDWVYNDRSAANSRRVRKGEGAHETDDGLFCQELGVRYRVSSRHAGEDPLLFLDLRVARRWLLENSQGKSFLNLFGYTCGAGVSAAKGGASEVWNVDFSKFALAFAQQNFQLNDIPESQYRLIESDCFAALKQLGGIPIKPRTKKLANGKRVPMALPNHPTLPQKAFDIVFLDPPKWAKSPFGTVDLVRDYQSLFKPALLATQPEGVLIACNNVAKVDCEQWQQDLIRCAEKQQRPIQKLTLLTPEQDFPSRDGKPPLKIAVCQF